MKQSQMILALVLVTGMVFVITFLMQYSPSSTAPPVMSQGKGDKGGSGSDNWIRLYETAYPPIPVGAETQQPQPIELEHGKPGYHDFWFVNETTEPIKLGLRSVNCTCSSLQAMIMPDAWKQRWLTVRTADSLDPGTTTDKELKELESKVEPVDLKTDSKVLASATVPPGAYGKLRMHWNGGKIGSQRITAKIWGGKPDDEKAELSVLMVFLDPLRMAVTDREINLGILTQKQLPYPHSFYIWSSTRDSLDLTASLSNRPGELGSDPVLVGKPIPLTPAECKQLEEQHVQTFMASTDVKRNDLNGHVRSAVRVPITVQARAADGTNPLEIGAFRRRIKISGEDIPPDLITVIIEGTSRGDVEADDGGRINFDTVNRTRGAIKMVTLRSDTPGMELEVDSSRMPSFLKAELSKPDIKKDGGRVWRLTVEILPNRASAGGKFPREDPPTYWDCAAYVRLLRPGAAANAPKEYLRVPVRGTITD